MDRVRRGGQQIADHEIALGDPRALIEQPRRLIERLHVEFDQGRAERGPALQRFAISRLRRLVAEEDQLSAARYAQAKICRHWRERLQRPVARVGIGGIGPCHRRERGHRVVDGERKHRYAVERAAGRHHAGGRDHAEARLQPDDVVEHRRHAAASRGVGAERERHEASGNRDRRAGARSARNEIAAHRIAGNAIRRAHADQSRGELVEIGLADDDGAGRAQPGHRGRILRRRIGEGRAGRGGRKAPGVDIVLHRDRHAVERKLRGILRVQAFGFGERVLLVAQADEDGGIVMVANAPIGAGDGFGGRQRPGAMRGDDRGNGFGHAKNSLSSLRRRHRSGSLNPAQSKQAVCHCVQRRHRGTDRNSLSPSIIWIDRRRSSAEHFSIACSSHGQFSSSSPCCCPG